MSKSRQREEYPLPETREGMKALVGDILAQPGKVMRIIIEAGQPVRAYRDVDGEDFSEDDVDLEGALRHAQIVEMVDRGQAASTVLAMLRKLELERLNPVCWVTGTGTGRVLERWLERDFNEYDLPAHGLKTIAGTRIERLSSLPEEAILLCGSAVADADYRDIQVVIRAAIEVRDERPSQDGHPGGDRSEEHPRAAGEVAAPSGRRPGGDRDLILRGGLAKSRGLRPRPPGGSDQ